MSQTLEERVAELERFKDLVSLKLREHLGLASENQPAKGKPKAREEKKS